MSQENFNDGVENSEEPGAGDALDALNQSSDMQFVTGEPKKPINRTSLVLFVIVALGGGGLYLMHAKTGPTSAAAATADAANKTINQFLSGGPTNIKLMEMSLRNTEKVIQEFNHPTVKQIPLGE